MIFDDDARLGDARAWLREHAREGAECPACKQHVRLYRRKLLGSMARVLIAFWRAERTHPGTWQQVFAVLKDDGIAYHGSDYGKLAYWDLLEPNPKKSGEWRITDLGMGFALNRETVLSHAIVYDGEVQRHNGDSISIVDALGKRFDYAELMAERPSGVPFL